MVHVAEIDVIPKSGHQTILSKNLEDLHPDVTVVARGNVWVLRASCDDGSCKLGALQNVVAAETGHLARCELFGSRISARRPCAKCQIYSYLK